MNSKSCKFVAPASKNEQDVALALCFFDFFRDVSCETIGFSTIFGQAPSRNGSKTYGLAWDVMKKVEKTSGDSSGGTGRLWRSGPALGGSGGALGGPGTALGASGGARLTQKKQNSENGFAPGSEAAQDG